MSDITRHGREKYSSAAGEKRHTILTPDQRVRVFISSVIEELATERLHVRDAIKLLRQTPVFFESGARPHAPRDLYQTELEQSDIFIGIYWQSYGWVAPGMIVSGIEDEYQLAMEKPRLIYIKAQAPERDPRLAALINRIRDEGSSSYKKFSTPEELRELVADDLALLLTERFATVAVLSVAPPRTELPVPRTNFVGREGEIASVVTLLGHSDVRLLTLTGPGGVGKTRLGIQVAAKLTNSFAEGSAFIDLAPLTDPALVPATILQVLGILPEGRQEPTERLRDYLADKSMLLVLDNFEHLVEAAPIVADLLSASPKLKVLATSRAPLHIQHEQEFAVEPLDLPPLTLLPLQELARNEAVDLFVRRARAVKPNFELTSDNVSSVTEICRRLDGLPLAIELAAARVRLFRPATLLKHLRPCLPLLVGGPRDVPARYRTMLDAIAWSHDLLTPEEQALFRRLAVFVGGFTLEAAEAVASASGTVLSRIIELINSLVEKNLLRQTDRPEGDPQFIMLEVIREYGLTQLSAAKDEEAARQAWAQYYLTLVEQAEPELLGPKQVQWLNQLEAEHDNVRAVLAWAAARDQEDRFVRMVGALWRFWEIRGYLAEGRGWLDQALDLNHSVPDEARAKTLMGAAALARAQSDHERARTLYEQGLAQFQALRDDKGIAFALHNLGNVARNEGHPELAKELYQQSLAMRRSIDDKRGIAVTLRNLGEVLARQGELKEAMTLFEESLALFRAIPDARGTARTLHDLAFLALEEHEHKRSMMLLADSLGLRRTLGDRYGVSVSLMAMASAVASLHPVQSARFLGAATALQEAIGSSLASDEQAVRHREASSLRSVLGREAFSRAWESGRALALEEAVDEALRVVSELADNSAPGSLGTVPIVDRVSLDALVHLNSDAIGDCNSL